MQQDQAHPQLHSVCCKSPRLQVYGACADGTAQGSTRGTCLTRRWICWDGRCRECEAHDTDNLRERTERRSLDGRTERAKATEVEGTQPSGTRLRIHGAGDGRFDFSRGRNDKGKSQHRIDEPSLQHVPTGANQEIPTQFNYNVTKRIQDNHHPAKEWQIFHYQMKK